MRGAFFKVICAVLFSWNAFSQELTFENLKTKIETEHISSVEEFLNRLPPEYLQHYSLLKDSSALQEASVKFPRVVTFGNDGKMVMTFNGDKSQDKFNVVEIMEFKDQTKTFEFRTIEFTPHGVDFGELNDIKCTACHGISTPSPLWDNAPNWRKSFGQYNDELTQEEKTTIANFINNPRYKFLVGNKPSNAEFGDKIILLQAEQLANRILVSDFYKVRPEIVRLALDRSLPLPNESQLTQTLKFLEEKYSATYGEYYLKRFIEKTMDLTPIQKINYLTKKMVFDLAYNPFQLEFGSYSFSETYTSNSYDLDSLVMAILSNSYSRIL